MKAVLIASLIALAFSASPAFERTFSPKTETVYKFDGLLLSGLPTTQTDNSQLRIQCRARVQAIDDRYIHVQLSQIQYASAHLPNNQQWPKLESLEQVELLDEHKELLELPVRAQLRNGLVSELQFTEEDAEWSKNMKRAVLNMISLQTSAPADEMNMDEQALDNQNQFYLALDNQNQFYTVNEKTIEGDCQVAYTVVREQEQTIYTKSVNFDKCISRPVVAYGYRFQTECKDCGNEGQYLKPQTVYTYIFENGKLQEVEVQSTYTLIVSGQEVVKSETRSKLVYQESTEIKNQIRKINGEKEELVYSTQWDQEAEEFFRNGDNAESKPFKQVPTEQKVQQAKWIVDQIEKLDENKPETAHLLARLVELFRMCTVEELHKIHPTLYVKSEPKIQMIMENALAIAGTKNTIKHLIHHIEMKEISPVRAVQLLKSIQETQYPSVLIAEMLVEFARTPLAKEYESIRQSAWLAAGSVVRGFTSQTADLPLIQENSRPIKEKFVRIFMQHFRNAESTYEKVLAIKALGNAGIDLAVFELSNLIHDQRQQLAVRIEAVDALRLLKEIMPRKIQKVLLPIYKNRQYAPELRMAALFRIMHTLPEQQVLAQLANQLDIESNQHVAAFTYTVLRQFARSTNPCYQRLAVSANRILLLTRYQPQEQILSTYSQLPLFNGNLNTGAQFDFATIFDKNGFLPKEFQASVETVLGGNWNKYFAQFGFSQQNFEYVIINALERLQQWNKESSSVRGRRVETGVKVLEDFMKKMNIRTRLPTADAQNAHAVFYLRYKEMDYVVLPIDKELLNQYIDQYVADGVFDIKAFKSLLTGDHKFNAHHAAFFYETYHKMPTTIGVPLTVSGKAPTVFSAEGKFQLELQGTEARLILDVQPSLAATHITEMRFWTPIVEQGVKSLQSVHVVTPLRFELNVVPKRDQFEVVYKVIVPQNKKTILSAFTRPVAFIRVPSTEEEQYVEAQEKTIVVPRIQLNVEEIEKAYEVFGLKMSVFGNILKQWTFGNLVQTEQNLEYTILNKNRPAEFVARLTIDGLKRAQLSEINFENTFEKEFETEEHMTEQRRETFHKMIREIKNGQGYKSLINLKFEAPQEQYINSELQTVCDQYVRVCKTELNLRRSPLAGENKEWTFSSELIAARPQMPSSLRQLREQPHREVQLALTARWGSNKKSEVTVNAQLQQSKEQKQYTRNIEQQFTGLPEYELLIKAARLNQLTAVADYKLTPEAQNVFNRFFDLIKVYNFWSISEQHTHHEQRRAVLQLTVDPITRKYLNMTVETPEQLVELKNVRVPYIRLPSIAQHAIRHQWTEKTTSSCKVDQSEISTFDNLIYNAQITPCYTLVAGDCSGKPKFSVLTKKINEDSDELSLNIKRQSEDIIVVKHGEQFLIKIDGEKIPTSELEQYNIEILGDNLVVITVPEGEVHFDGFVIKTNLKSTVSQVCGLCGNNDGETDNEFYTADNFETEDIDEFHGSYTLKDGKCKTQQQQKTRASGKKTVSKKWNRDSQYEQTEQYDEVYPESRAQPKLTKKTLVKEFSHRVCFSLAPVNQCGEQFEAENVITEKVRFTCMPRHSSDARRFLKEAREQVLDLSDYLVSYVEAVKMPQTCVAF